LATAANVFVGQTEAPLVVRPYIAAMTMSELNALMVGGFATIAGGVLAAYVDMGISATHLLSASVISAPAALLIAKVMQPEVEKPKTLGRVEIHVDDPSQNVLEAFASGAVSGLKLALNVGAMLIAFLALIAVINVLLGWCAAQYQAIGERLDWLAAGDPPAWSLEAALGSLFAPLAWVMGIAREDCFAAGELLGLRMAANEFVAYAQLAEWTPLNADGVASEAVISHRSREILTYALCGFANFSSIGIQLGGIGGIVPERRGDLAKLGFRAMLGGTLAAFMTACVAGVLL
jgi:CNT family concentrative nucleoside transporter